MAKHIVTCRFCKKKFDTNTTDYIMPKEEKKEAPIQQIKPNNLIESIKKYAISEKKRKEQNKASKKKRKIGNLSK